MGALGQEIRQRLANRLHEAETSRQPVPPLSAEFPEMGEEDAYSVQNLNAVRSISHGDRLVGYKIGLTSREAQRHFKVFKPDYGHLFDRMCVLEDTEVALGSLIQPKIEGEIAFVLGRDMRGPGLTIVDALNAIDYATVSMEIIDSRIQNWKISAVDTIADNGSSALYVLGGKRTPIANLDFAHLGMNLSRNGEILVTGAGAAVMGNPLSAVVFLANELARQNKGLLAGEVVLSGSLAGMLTMNHGDVFTCEIRSLGKVSVRCPRATTGGAL
jgi:2-keto-4-pentenoate hydratase